MNPSPKLMLITASMPSEQKRVLSEQKRVHQKNPLNKLGPIENNNFQRVIYQGMYLKKVHTSLPFTPKQKGPPDSPRSATSFPLDLHSKMAASSCLYLLLLLPIAAFLPIVFGQCPTGWQPDGSE
jgi:hypothetical protein